MMRDSANRHGSMSITSRIERPYTQFAEFNVFGGAGSRTGPDLTGLFNEVSADNRPAELLSIAALLRIERQ